MTENANKPNDSLKPSEGHSLKPSDGHIVEGVQIDTHCFSGRMRAGQLMQVCVDPRETEKETAYSGNPILEANRKIRLEVQRLFTGAKEKNVPSYANYIVGVQKGEKDGSTPPIVLYCPTELKIRETEVGAQVQIPWDTQLVAIDGETQLAARFEAAKILPETKNAFVPFILHSNRTTAWARQVFHDLNTLAVRPNVAISIGMDLRDPLTQITREVSEHVPFFKGRVDASRRQLRKSDKAVVTIATLRGGCITLTKGIAGVKYGAKPVSDIDPKDLPRIRKVSQMWWDAISKSIGSALERREETVAASPAVMAALGAVGHRLLNLESDAEREVETKRLVADLAKVDWTRGKNWEGVAGKFTAKGVFSLGGAKENAYAVYAALTDPAVDSYRRVRKAIAAA